MNKRFFLKLTLFLLPICLYLLITVGLPAYAGEFTPMDQVARMQMGETPVLYGRAYRDNFVAFKQISTRLRKPEILALGSSRVLPLRANLFNKKKGVFYNAGSAGPSLAADLDFLENLPVDALPKILILGLDQEWFKRYDPAQPLPKWPGKGNLQAQMDQESTLSFDHIESVSSIVLQDILSGKLKLDRLLARHDPVHDGPALGIRAEMIGEGFRNDGSIQSGQIFTTPRPTQDRIADTVTGIRQRGEGGFVIYQASNEIDPTSFDQLEAILKFCQQRNIYVLAFSPPYAPTVYTLMQTDGGYQFLPKMVVQLGTLFERYGYKYFDFSDVSAFGVTDEDMVDGYHANEFAYLQIVVAMLKRAPEILGNYSDLAYLENLPIPNRFDIFGTKFQ